MNEAIENLLRADLRGRTPYGAPQLDVPVRLNTNENSYAVPDDVVAAITAAVTETARHLNRYPDREFTELREALAAYLRSQTGVGITTEQVWAGNGSNEVLLHLVQAFGGVGRTALGFTPAYSMHPIITRTTGDDVGRRAAGHAERRLRPRRRTRGATGPRAPAAHRLPLLAEQPDRHRLVPRRRRGRRRRGPGLPGRRGRGLRRVRPAGHAERDDPARGPAAARRHPDHEQGVRPRRRPASATSPPTPTSSTRSGWCGCPTTCPTPPRPSRSPRSATTPSLLATVEAIKAQRDRIVAELGTASGYPPVPSDANFVLYGGLADAHATWQALLDRGVLVRDVGIPHHLRVTAGHAAESVDVPAGDGRSARLAPAARTRPRRRGHDRRDRTTGAPA